MKTLKKIAMALALIAMPLLASAQGDLAAFNLKGKVKSCTWVNHKAGCLQYGFSKNANKETTVFNQNGRCTKWNDILFAAQGRSGSALHNECKRDAKGRIVYGSLYGGFYAPGFGEETLEYDANGKLARLVYEDAGATIETTFEYDAEGTMIRSTSNIENNMEETNETITVEYKVLAKDAHGNWTKRIAKPSKGVQWPEVRTIVYYELDKSKK